MIKMLLEKGANPQAESKFFGTPLAAAAIKYDTDPDALRTLIEADPDLIYKPHKVAMLVKIMIRMMSVFGAFGNVKFSGMKRIMTEVKERKGRTPLHHAAARGDVAMVKTMLAARPPPPLTARVLPPEDLAANKFAPHLVTSDAIKSAMVEHSKSEPPAVLKSKDVELKAVAV